MGVLTRRVVVSQPNVLATVVMLLASRLPNPRPLLLRSRHHNLLLRSRHHSLLLSSRHHSLQLHLFVSFVMIFRLLVWSKKERIASMFLKRLRKNATKMDLGSRRNIANLVAIPPGMAMMEIYAAVETLSKCPETESLAPKVR